MPSVILVYPTTKAVKKDFILKIMTLVLTFVYCDSANIHSFILS